MDNTTSIHPDTRLGAVHLTVPDLDRSLAFYQRVLGFKVRRREGDIAYLGAGGPDLLVLVGQPGARHVRGTTGLYHFAVLVPSRLELARWLQHVAKIRGPIGGASDHHVSQAIYLSDPDGNGIEVYCDRPRSAWTDEQGRFSMSTEPLDLDSLMAELEGQPELWSGMHPKTTIGHIHLRVATIPQTEAFYHGVLGFDVIAHYGPSATFMSAGGYHHHIGANTWESRGAPPPPPDAAGLRHFTILLPNREELVKVADRVQAAGVTPEERDEGFFVRDPSQNGVMLAANNKGTQGNS